MKEELKVVRELLNKRNNELNEANSIIYQKDCMLKSLQEDADKKQFEINKLLRELDDFKD
jgi:hypothetical protein